jgi:hypothetical protein
MNITDHLGLPINFETAIKKDIEYERDKKIKRILGNNCKTRHS